MTIDADLKQFGKALSDIVSDAFGLSKSDARRQMKAGAIRIENIQVKDEFARLVSDGKDFWVILSNKDFIPESSNDRTKVFET